MPPRSLEAAQPPSLSRTRQDDFTDLNKKDEIYSNRSSTDMTSRMEENPKKSNTRRGLQKYSSERFVSRESSASKGLRRSRSSNSLNSLGRSKRKGGNGPFFDDKGSEEKDIDENVAEEKEEKKEETVNQESATPKNEDNNVEEEDDGNVRVVIRVRPILSDTVEYNSPLCVEVLPPIAPSTWNSAVQIRGKGEDKTFTFDEVLPQHVNQRHVYNNCVSPLIDSCLKNAHNATVFAYGQTGSGKTYTMMGNGNGLDEKDGNKKSLPQHEQKDHKQNSDNEEKEEEEEDESWRDWGVIPRTLRSIFTKLENEKNRRTTKSGRHRFHYEVDVQSVELYGEKIRDLLTPFQRRDSLRSSSASSPQTTPKIRETTNSSGAIETEVIGAKTISVSTYDEAMRHIRRGMRTRVIASTDMNDVSSRSHCITTVRVTQWKRKKKKKHHRRAGSESVYSSPSIGTNGKEEVQVRECKIRLVDLAGSESLKRTQAEGKRMKEGTNINKGLTVLGRVLTALGRKDPDKQLVIPYKDSKLTHLLKGSLGGNHMTLMIACISPSSLNQEESLRCLRYASRAKFIENKVETNSAAENEDSSKDAEVLDMRLQMKEMESKITSQQNQMKSMALEIRQLRERERKHNIMRELRGELNNNDSSEKGENESSLENGDDNTGESNNFRTRFEEYELEMTTHIDQMKFMASEMLCLEKNTGDLFFKRTLLKVLAQGQTISPKVVEVMKDVELQNDAEKAQMMERTIHETFGLPPDDIPPPSPSSPPDGDVEHTPAAAEEEEKEVDESTQTNNQLPDEEVSSLKEELQAVKEERDLLLHQLEDEASQTKNQLSDEEVSSLKEELQAVKEERDLLIQRLEDEASQNKSELLDEEVPSLKGELQAVKEERDLLEERLAFQLEKNKLHDGETDPDKPVADMAQHFDYPYLKDGYTTNDSPSKETKESRRKKKKKEERDLLIERLESKIPKSPVRHANEEDNAIKPDAVEKNLDYPYFEGGAATDQSSKEKKSRRKKKKGKEERELLVKQLESQILNHPMLNNTSEEERAFKSDAIEQNLDLPYLESGGAMTDQSSKEKKSRRKKKSIPYRDSSPLSQDAFSSHDYNKHARSRGRSALNSSVPHSNYSESEHRNRSSSLGGDRHTSKHRKKKSRSVSNTRPRREREYKFAQPL